MFPIFNVKGKRVVKDGIHQMQPLFQFEDSQFQQMAYRQRCQLEDPTKIQTWMFQESIQDSLSIETKLVSNVISNEKVIIYILTLNDPESLTVENAERMLKKLRSLQVKNPV